MLKIGASNNLEVIKITSSEILLSGLDDEDVVLSPKQAPEELKEGDNIDVFVYRNQDNVVIATSATPKIKVDSFACLEVVDVYEDGVLFDMGLEDPLWVPEDEVSANVKIGNRWIVYMILDEESEWLLGSMRWADFCFEEEPDFEVNQKVQIMIGEKTDLGRNVLINNAFDGLIYENEIYEKVQIGEVKDAFIKTLREDGNIDVILQKKGYGNVVSSSGKILELLKANNGVLEIGDKSSPEKIRNLTRMSKKTFKKAIGDLYKKKLVLLEKEQVRLVE